MITGDIVQRLRYTPMYEGSGESSDLSERAADEIDRLSSRIAALESILRELTAPWPENIPATNSMDNHFLLIARAREVLKEGSGA